MSRSPAPRRGEDGFSIVETVVALAVLAMIIPSLMGALFIAVKSSQNQRARSVGTQVALGVAEVVKADPYSPTGVTYSIVGAAVPTGSSVADTCTQVAGQPASFPLQMVTITVTSQSGSQAATTSLVVIKSNR
jgi:type II secretory pathway pseudopilin PulG